MTSQAAGLNALGSSPRWNLLSDRIERSLEDVLSDVPSLVPPRAQTAPPPQGALLEDLFDAGNDVRLDLAYPEFYRDQGAHAQLPSPLDTTTLLSNIARQLLDEKARSSSRQDINAGQNVQQLFHALQGLQEARSKAQTPAAPHDVQSSLADGLAQMRLANLEAAASLSRNGTPQPNLAQQYSASPGPYRSQLSPAPHSGRQSPMPRSDPRFYAQDVQDVHVADPPPHAAYMQGSSQGPTPPYPSSFPPSNPMTDPNPRLRPDLHGGPTLPTHPNVPGSINQLGYPGAAPRPTHPGAPHLPAHGPPPAPSSFQSTFNAAYYAACLAQQGPGGPSQAPPGPPVVMDPAGHILPMRDVPYAPSALHPPYMEPRSGAVAMGGRGRGRAPYPGMAVGPNMPSPHMEDSGPPPGGPHSGRGGGRGGGASLQRDRAKPARREPSRRDRQVFETGTQMDLTLTELSGRILEMAKEQHGCRYLQRLLGSATPSEVQLLLDEVLPHIGTLMVDPFGNYLVQKVLDVCTPAQRLAVLERACTAPGGLPEITRNTHGTRAAQKLVEAIETPEEAAMFIAQLRPQCLRLILDGNSNHVVQRCLQKFDAEHTVDIMDTVAAHCHDVARHRHGCCVLQRCMDYAAPERKRVLVLRVSKHGLDLSQNAFGNYVVQYILDTGMVDACESILQQLQGRFAFLSCQKFASNVVEKALKLTTVGMEHWRAIIVQELIDAPDHADLLKDQFGNYVLQSALRVTSGDLHGRLVAAIKPHMACLKSLQHGKRILQQLQGAV